MLWNIRISNDAIRISLQILKLLNFSLSQGVYSYQSCGHRYLIAIAGLGKNTGKASSFLIMMILGEALIKAEFAI
jgi:hypothetical protein